MFGKYINKIEKNNSFMAGYEISVQKGDNHPVFLFTSLRIVRVISGTSEWKIGSKIHLIKENDIIVVNNMEPRQFLRTFNTEFKCEVFAFSPVVFGNDIGCFSLFFNKSKDFNPIITQYTDDTSELHLMLDILKRKITDTIHSDHSKSSVCTLITSICATILHIVSINSDNKFNTKPMSVSAAELVIKSIEYIYENASENIGVSDLAENVSVSREYFSRIFKKYTGITPATFITQCKINNTIRLICTKNINILDAALESGFNTSSGFYQAFHTIYGMSPKKFLSSRNDN